eukprot:g1866.t1
MTVQPDNTKWMGCRWQDDFKSVTIFGSDETRKDTWKEILENLKSLHGRYAEENSRRLEKVLVSFASWCLLGLALFILDRLSDWVCDWWSTTCAEASKVAMMGYSVIAVYVGFHAYLAYHDQGRLAVVMAGGELWKEMVRLMGVSSPRRARKRARARFDTGGTGLRVVHLQVRC